MARMAKLHESCHHVDGVTSGYDHTTTDNHTMVEPMTSKLRHVEQIELGWQEELLEPQYANLEEGRVVCALTPAVFPFFSAALSAVMVKEQQKLYEQA